MTLIENLISQIEALQILVSKNYKKNLNEKISETHTLKILNYASLNWIIQFL